mmetsp:Transcript_41622/g.85605  ORF Transcript_41622/g.85605 Transcript_41622/m.85605 type:complete len:523 (+) Transcript_41622:31-1599(+)
MAATATTRPAKPRRKLDTAQREGIEQLLEHDKRHLLKVRDLQSKSQALLKPEDIQVVLYDVYSVDSFAACCVARKFLGLGVHYEGVTRGSCVQHLSLDAEGLDGKAVALLGLCWKVVDILDLCMEYHCRVLIMDTHRGVKEEIEHASDNCLVFVDEEMGAGVLAWNYFFETKPVPVILRAIEDAHLGRGAFRDGRALEDGLDALDSGFVKALGEKRHVKVALKDSTFQIFGDLIEDKDLAKQQISEAIAAGKQVECEIYEKGKEASRSSAVRTFRVFPAWKCNVVFMQSPHEGRVAESLAVELANSCKGAGHRCFGAVVDFRGAGARVILRSGPGGPDVSQVARHYEGSGSSTRAFFMIDAANVDSMFVKPEIVLRQVALQDEHCLQAQPGDNVTVIYRGERKPSTPFDQWSWCYKSDDPKQEGWLPTFSHTLFVATRSEPSGGQGTEKVSEGDLILPLALRGDFLLGTRLSLGPAPNLSNLWFPFDHELYKPVQPSSAKVIVEEASLFFAPNSRVAGYGCA